MRAVCFVKRLEFDVCGNVFPNALRLGDVNNDGNHELVVGNVDGDLIIFKQDMIWQTFSNLGMITSVIIGDIFSCGRNAVIVVCGDGWCHILFAWQQASEGIDGSNSGKLEIVHVQRIPANTKVALLGDIDGDGNNELVLGLTDRVVRSYRWVRQDGEGSRPDLGKLVGLNKWECASQIGTVTIHHSPEGSTSLLVAQPGGTLMKIHCHYPATGEIEESYSEELTSTSIDYHPLSLSHMRNPNVSTEIVGDVRPPDNAKEGSTMRYAVATLDGTLMLVQNEDILWSIQVDHQLFALTKLYMTDGEGNGDNIIACSWDGQTYILDQEKRSVRFQLEESVRAFCSGLYNLKPNQPATPCLVYTTFTNKVYIYYDVKIPSMVARSSGPRLDVGLPNQTEEDKKRARRLTEWCLYGKRT
ncbi:KICSTOR complex protein ITFG2 [Anabrus simplex]|uniref:KICSTOR complex protein ITFG2 n=1 Tax=Anabrus simplex TaxID=316456 RepID=UPI0035A380AF